MMIIYPSRTISITDVVVASRVCMVFTSVDARCFELVVYRWMHDWDTVSWGLELSFAMSKIWLLSNIRGDTKHHCIFKHKSLE